MLNLPPPPRLDRCRQALPGSTVLGPQLARRTNLWQHIVHEGEHTLLHLARVLRAQNDLHRKGVVVHASGGWVGESSREIGALSKLSFVCIPARMPPALTISLCFSDTSMEVDEVM